MIHWTLFSINWCFCGDLKLGERTKYFEKIRYFKLPENIEWPQITEKISLIDYAVRIEDGEWETWKSRVPVQDLGVKNVSRSDVIIPTVDTLRH